MAKSTCKQFELDRSNSFIPALFFALALLLFNTLAHAQDGKTILVLDASGSMWQKISDGYKIRIAQDVINELLVTLPVEQELGLITYGHRRKGDCGDIEMLVPPGAGTRDAISSAIKSLDPKGKTPLSAAVIQAADVLRIEENASTVILVSDGRETCDLDPCAVGSELEDRGIDFTTHVIGFDVGEENDREQLRCLAENTGGKFLTASTASELTQALVEVSQPIEKLTMSAFAVDEEDNDIIEGLIWSLLPAGISEDSNSSQQFVPADQQDARFIQLELDPGQYAVMVTREEDGASATLDINLQASGNTRFKLSLPALQYTARVEGPDKVIIGERFEVQWEGPARANDRITLALPDSAPMDALEYLLAANPNPVIFPAPTTPGEYEIRYEQGIPERVLASAVITVEDAPATLKAQDIAPAATSIPIQWTGPDQKYDLVAVVIPGDKAEITGQRTSDGTPLQLQMPPEPGEYELRYILYADTTVLATRPITVEAADVSIEAADVAEVGERIPVAWAGPDERYDTVAIVSVDNRDQIINATRTSRGNPLQLEMPTTAGKYELRYISYTFNTPLITRPISVVESIVEINAPLETSIGESVTVTWVGPDETYDVIAVAEIGSIENINETRTSKGSPLELQMPSTPGEFEIRYMLYQDRKILGTRLITVNDAIVSLEAVDEADVSEFVDITWEGPDAQYDYITIAKVGEKRALNQTQTGRGNPLELQMPATSGEYEIRYVLYQDHKVLATKPITVKEVSASLEVVDEADVSEFVDITWEGPDAQYDYIAIAEVGEKRVINQTQTGRGNPLKLQMPATSGEYEIRYVLYQYQKALATRPITINDVSVMLDAADEADVSEKIEVTWDGPGAQYDYIAIAKVGEKRTINQTQTGRGNPLELQMPSKSGEYEIRYVLYQNQRVLATRPITVNDVSAMLDAAEEADISDKIDVTWDGPDAAHDYIAIAEAGEKKLINRTRTSRGNPLELTMPSKPGDYEIRYILYQDKKVLATRPISVNDVSTSLDALDEAGISAMVDVHWDGPDAANDYIAVAKVGKKKLINRARTSKGSPLELQMPSQAGDYEIRYILYQGKRVMATRSITVNNVDVTLNAPDQAQPDEVIDIIWEGPDARADHIEIARIGEKKVVRRVRTSSGSPLQLRMPAEPGEYELRYVLSQDRRVLATRTIVVGE